MAITAKPKLWDHKLSDQHNARQINEQPTQDKTRESNSFDDNLNTNNKCTQEREYFIASPGMEADKEASTDTAL